MWSTVQHEVLSNGAVTNSYDGCLDAQAITIYVRYHTPSTNKTHKIIRKIKRGGMLGVLKHSSHKSYIRSMA